MVKITVWIQRALKYLIIISTSNIDLVLGSLDFNELLNVFNLRASLHLIYDFEHYLLSNYYIVWCSFQYNSIVSFAIYIECVYDITHIDFISLSFENVDFDNSTTKWENMTEVHYD